MVHDRSLLTRWTQTGRLLSKGLSRILPLEAALQFEISSHRVFIPNLPEVFESFRVVQLSDIHFYEFSCSAYYQSVVDAVNSLNPDAVVITGDIIHYGHRYLGFGASFLKQIKAREGKWSCMGNHDYSDDYRGEALREMLEESGFQPLVNESIVIERENRRLRLSGVDDCKKGHPDPDEAYCSVENGDVHISLVHNPALAPYLNLESHAPNLILAGHTHGGQIKHWLINWIQRPLLNTPYRYGWFPLGQSQLYVTSGIGSASLAVHLPHFDFALYPFRINTSPEIALFELTGLPASEKGDQPAC